MAEQEALILSDKEVIPTEENILSILGDKQEFWKSILKNATENYKDTAGTWKYYNDGKQWLFKMVQKKKTLFWGGIHKATFRITFYFGNKAEPVIEASDLPKSIIDGFKTGKRYGAIRAISINVFEQSDVENVLKLIAIKSKLK
mgnify:CR=1 FL=1